MALKDHLASLRLYEFEPDARLADSAGKGPALTGVNDPGFATGHVGEALSLVAAQDQYVRDDATAFTGARSILAWLYDSAGATQRANLLVFGLAAGEKIVAGPYDGAVRMTFGSQTYTLPLTTPIGEWYMLGATTGATRADCRVWMWTASGGLVSAAPSGTGAATAVGDSTGVAAGSDGTANRDWQGLIDQLLVLPGAALTEAEIAEYVAGGAGVSYADITAEDMAPPTLQSATISQDGLSLTLSFDEAVQAGPGGPGGFALSASGGAATLTYASGGGTTSLVYTISRAVQYGETATLDYVQPGDGIEDLSGNDLASFADQAVTNGSETGAPTPSITGTLSVAGGAAVASGTMYAASIASDAIAEATVGADGTFAFMGLAPGTYRVWGETEVSGSTYTTQARIVEVA